MIASAWQIRQSLLKCSQGLKSSQRRGLFKRVTEEQLQMQSMQFLVEAALLDMPCQERETKLHDSKCMVESP